MLFLCRTHVPYSSPVDGLGLTQVNISTFVASLLYCELFVDLLQQNNQKDKDILQYVKVLFLTLYVFESRS